MSPSPRAARCFAAVALALAATVLPATAAAAAPTLRSVSSAKSASASALTIPAPAGTLAGDVLVAALDVRVDRSVTLTAPDGWSLVRRDSAKGSALMTQAVYVKTAGAFEPTGYRWRFGTAAVSAGGILRYEGVDGANPVAASGGRYGAKTAKIIAPSVSAPGDAAVVGVFGTSGKSAVAPAGGLSERYDEQLASTRNVSSAAADSLRLLAGLTGELVAVAATASSHTIGQTIVLRGAAAATEPEPEPAPAPPADTTAPDTAIAGGPDEGASTTATDASFTFSSTEAGSTFECSLDGAGFASCASPAYYSGLQAGSHSFRVRATDAAGNTDASPAQRTWTVAEPAPSPLLGGSLPARLALSTGTAFYVSTSGSDANPGTEAAPWRTIQKALNTLTAGQQALVRGGTYAQNLVLSRGGTASAPITIRNYPGERPVLAAGSGATNNMPLSLASGAAYVRFQGLAFAGATGTSTTNIYAYGSARDIEFSDCEVSGSQRQGFFSERTTARIHIIGCHFHHNGGSGPLQQDHNVYIQGSYHAIIGSLLRNVPNGFGVQIYPSNDHIVVANNTIDANYRDGIIIGSDGSTTTSHATVVNNVITNSRSAVSTYWGGAVGTGNLVRNNIAYGTSSTAFTGSGVTYEANRVANPLFRDRASGDYRLLDGSPALSGSDAAFTPVSDMDGRSRPIGGGPDLGSYER
ncbi:MAG TPA: right-handed parallel beta-helix repeat-containing protein [Solirubrobacteraceae bacterium]|nr:right-handed parallel beta-helix repeat-containing protein [Solirubrobacteraceae bacterium]